MKPRLHFPSRIALFAAGLLGGPAVRAQTELPPKPSDPSVRVEERQIVPAAKTETETTAETPAESEATPVTTGNVFSIDADTFSVTPEKVTIPLNFMYNSKTVFVDEADKPVPWEHLRGGLPVTVSYATLGEKMLATKVIATRWMIDGGKKEGNPSDAQGIKREELAKAKKRKDAEVATKRVATAATSGTGTIMGFEQVIAVRPPGSSEVVQYVVNNSTHFVDTAGQPVAPNFVRTGTPVSIKFVEDAGRKIATEFVMEGPLTPAPATGATGTSQTNNPTASSRTSSSGNGGSITTGVPDVAFEGAFINPPASTLSAARGTQTNNGNNPAAGTNGAAQTVNRGTATTGTTTGQPGGLNTPQPPVSQPSTTQPATKQPAAGQPSTPPASTRSAPSTSSNAPTPAPARR